MLSVVRDRMSFSRCKSAIVGSFVVVCCLTAAPASAVPIVSVSPSSSNLFVGDTVTVNIDVSGVSDLHAFQFEIFFDPSILMASDPIQGSILSSAGTTIPFEPFIHNGDGYILHFDSLLDAAAVASGNGTLLTLTFTALKAGSSAIMLDFDPTRLNGLFDPGFGDISFDTDCNSESCDGASALINVSERPTSVPEPGTLLLLSSGLAATVVASRRRRRRAPKTRL